MSQALKCDICGDLFEGHTRTGLAPLVKWRSGSTHVYLGVSLSLTPGPQKSDACDSCFEATLRAAVALFDVVAEEKP